MRRVARTIRGHWDAIPAYMRTPVINGIIQTVKRKARGFNTVEYVLAIIYLVASHLEFDLPDAVPASTQVILRPFFRDPLE